jgi:uncharacterized membrane protein YqiK
MDDLSAQMEASEKKLEAQDQVSSHISALADRLREVYDVTEKQSRIIREKQKACYDKNTKLVMFSEGNYVYLKEMAVGVGRSKNFRNRWQGPYLITR